jgi:hypothetical protein
MTEREVYIMWIVVTFLAGAIILYVFWLLP